MNLYIAAPCAESPRAHALAEALRQAGFTVVSTWHAGGVVPDDEGGPDALRWAALACNKADLAAADGLIVLAHRGNPRETFVEAGRFLARHATAYAVWAHGPNGQGLALSAFEAGVRRVELHDTPADIDILVGCADVLRARWSATFAPPRGGMAVVAYETADEDNA